MAVKIDGQFYDIPKAVRCWQKFSSETRANLMSSHRVGFRQKERFGEFYWTHPLIPNRAYPTRKAAYSAALETLIP
jgi:hypothetical protein